MDKLVIEGHKHLPSITLDPAAERFEIRGKSIPENAHELFEPVIQWLTAYCQQPNEITRFDFRLEYFNTSTSKYILEIARKLERLYFDSKKGVVIRWYAEEGDSDVEDAGMDYKAILKCPFEVITVNSTGYILKVRETDKPLYYGGQGRASDTAAAQVDVAAPEPVIEAQSDDEAVTREEFQIVSSISDRLQKKLNQANEQLKSQAKEIQEINQQLSQQNKQLQETVDALTRARAGRKAAGILLVLATFLFVFSEVVEYGIETMTSNVLSWYWVVSIKLCIALLIRPAERLVETLILQRNPGQ